VSWVPVEERDFSWKSEMENDVICAVASLAGERLFFGNDNSQGVGGDLHQSTAMVTMMLNRAGMGDTIASRSGNFDGDGPKRMNESDEKVEAYLQVLYQRASTLLKENESFVLAIAHALVSRRTITGEDITAIERGVTLDGGWYHKAINQDALRRFHQSAFEAHNAMLPHAVLTLPPLPPVPTQSSTMSIPPPPPAGLLPPPAPLRSASAPPRSTLSWPTQSSMLSMAAPVGSLPPPVPMFVPPPPPPAAH
jgi:cell division protease FtsH